MVSQVFFSSKCSSSKCSSSFPSFSIVVKEVLPWIWMLQIEVGLQFIALTGKKAAKGKSSSFSVSVDAAAAALHHLQFP